ncbi:TerD family protein [Streptomyces sp. NPDC091371]|uniref:TerD family protein n=1 Tax=Streptomyces sp. NPDC091371 TaxID=3155303 RepID=UPI0034388334
MTITERGANTPLACGPFRVTVGRTARPGTVAVAAAAVLLDAVGRVRDDADVVLADGPRHPSGAVRHLGGAEEGGQLVQRLEVDPDDVEPAVQRVLIAAFAAGGPFGAVDGLYVEVAAGDGTPVARYEAADAAMDTALVLGECYRRDGAWRFRAVGQGYTAGPAALAADFGIRPEALPAAPVTGPAMTEVDKVDAAPPPVGPRDSGAPAGPVPYDCVYEGTGDQEITVPNPHPGEESVLDYEVLGATDSGTRFSVYRIDDQNEPVLAINRREHGLRGRRLAFGSGGSAMRLRIEANCDWRLRLRPADTVEALGTGGSGRGTTVLWYGGPPALIRLEREGPGDDWVQLSTFQPDGPGLFVTHTKDRHPVTGPLAVGPEGWAHVVVVTPETVPWKLTVLPLHSAPVLEGKLAGRGAQVVRVPANGAKAEVRHGSRRAPSLTVMFALDEDLTPLERLCTEPGVYDLPPGLVSLRALEKWSLRVRD